jgi:hypothetical protein
LFDRGVVPWRKLAQDANAHCPARYGLVIILSSSGDDSLESESLDEVSNTSSESDLTDNESVLTDDIANEAGDNEGDFDGPRAGCSCQSAAGRDTLASFAFGFLIFALRKLRRGAQL